MSSEIFYFFFLRTRVASHLSNLPYNVLKKRAKDARFELLMHEINQNWVSSDVQAFLHTCGKSLLVEWNSVSSPLQLHVHAWQSASLTHKLHCQSGGARRAIWQFKLGPQGPGTWGQTQTNTITCQQLCFNKLCLKSNKEEKDCLPSFSDFSEMSLSFHRHLFCSEFLK